MGKFPKELFGSLRGWKINSQKMKDELRRDWNKHEKYLNKPLFSKNQRYKFCPKCSEKLIQNKNKFTCINCRYVMYLNPKPTTAGIIMRSNKIMFVKRRKAPFKNWWDLPGGFLDEKETPEQCMIREMKEETGLLVKPVRFLGFKNDQYHDQRALGTFFLCKIVSGKEIAGDDAAEIRWFDKNALPRNVAFRGVREGLKEFAGAKFTNKVVK